MYIQVEQTPNENALKFLVPNLCNQGLIFDYEREDDEEKTGFVKKLFEEESIVRIFVTSDFVTVTKKAEESFENLKPFIFQTLFEATLNPKLTQKIEEVAEEGELCEVSKQIIEILEERIKPAVAMDGGDVSFVKFEAETGIVYLKLKGSCSGCPSAEVTLQHGIKRTLQHYVPEVYDVASYT